MNTLQTLLSDARKFDPAYPSPRAAGFKASNHVPMALIALAKLGATDQRLKEYYDKGIEPLVEVSKNELVINKENFSKHLGDQAAYDAYYRFLYQEYDQQGRKSFLNKYLDFFADGVFTHLFHPLIRISYALEVDDVEEIIAGFAYFSAHYQKSLVNDLSKESEKDVLTLAKQLSKAFAGDATPLSEVLSKLEVIESSKEFHEIVSKMKFNEMSLAAIVDFNRRIYTSKPNIFSLHMVTSAYAIRTVMPYIKNKNRLLRYYWYAIAVIYTVLDCVDVSLSKSIERQLTIDEIKRKAMASNNEHVIKLAHACLQEAEFYKDEAFLSLAERVLP